MIRTILYALVGALFIGGFFGLSMGIAVDYPVEGLLVGGILGGLLGANLARRVNSWESKKPHSYWYLALEIIGLQIAISLLVAAGLSAVIVLASGESLSLSTIFVPVFVSETFLSSAVWLISDVVSSWLSVWYLLHTGVLNDSHEPRRVALAIVGVWGGIWGFFTGLPFLMGFAPSLLDIVASLIQIALPALFVFLFLSHYQKRPLW